MSLRNLRHSLLPPSLNVMAWALELVIPNILALFTCPVELSDMVFSFSHRKMTLYGGGGAAKLFKVPQCGTFFSVIRGELPMFSLNRKAASLFFVLSPPTPLLSKWVPLCLPRNGALWQLKDSEVAEAHAPAEQDSSFPWWHPTSLLHTSFSSTKTILILPLRLLCKGFQSSSQKESFLSKYLPTSIFLFRGVSKGRARVS